jgi:hypothetical protein
MDTETNRPQHRLSSLETDLYDALKPQDDRLAEIRRLMAKMEAMQYGSKAVFTSFPACNSNA